MKITIDNSYSRVEGLKTDQFRALRKLLSYESDPQAAYYSGGFRRVKYLIDSKGFFPTGLLQKVVSFCGSLQAVAIVDKRIDPRGLLQEHVYIPTPYPDQIYAADTAITVGRGTISMPTGSGKSKVIQLIADKLGLRTLVVVPNLEIKKQLQETLSGCDNVTVENIDSTRLSKLKDCDCLIIDEAHHVAAKTYQTLNKTAWNGIYYRFFLTATPFRNNDTENLLFESIAGEVIYRLTYKEAVSKGYIVPVEAYYIDIPKVSSDGHTWSQVYSELVVNNTVRNEMLGLTLLRLNASKVSFLCLVKEIAHGNILSDLTGLCFVNGQDGMASSGIKAFNTGALKALIGTTGILSEGVDTKPCEYVIIAGLGKAKSNFMQSIGRAVRTYPGKESAKVIILKDNSHKWTIAHFRAQKKILLEEYGVKVTRLEL